MTWFINATLATLLIGVTGCGEPSIGSLPVTGTIKVDGKPIEGATVVFNPDGSGRSASGLTDAQGKYKLTTVVSGDGALPGKYKIGVSKHENEKMDLPTVESGDSKALEAIYNKVDTSKATKSQNQIAAKYENADSSGLVAEVKSPGPNNFDLEVKSK